MECFHAFCNRSLSGWKHTRSSALNSKNAVLTLGCFWGLGAKTISTAWLWAWSINTMAVLTVSWSSIGQILCVIGSGASLVSIFRLSNTLVECYKEYLGSGYMRGLLDYPTFDAKLLKRCLQKTASTVFGTLDPLSMTEFIVTRLKGAGHRDWMQSRQPLQRAIEAVDFSLPVLIDVVSNLIGVWPLIVYYLKKTGKKDSGESLIVCIFLALSTSAWLPLFISISMFRRKG